MMTKLPKIKRMKLDRRLRIMKNENNGLHSILALTLLTSRMLGFFPVTGLCNKTSHALRFTLKSPYTLFCGFTMIGQCILSGTHFYWLVVNEFNMWIFSHFIFCAANLGTFIFLLITGWAWPQFISKVEQRERMLPPFTRNVKRYCNVITLVNLFMTLVERVLFMIYSLTVAGASNNSEKYGEIYFTSRMPFIFNIISFGLWKGVIIELFIIQSILMWPHNDVVIMVLSIYLTEHFSLHYHHLKKAIQQEMFSADVFRCHYMTIVKLVDLINKRFGFIIMTSIGCNLYLICIQLCYSLTQKSITKGEEIKIDGEFSNMTFHEVERLLLYTISVSVLLIRTLLVLFLAARVHSASKAPLTLLYEIPSIKFTVEVQRYADEIKNLKVAMSGLGFFYVTRSMILTIIGSIITYELVLLQFNEWK